MTGPKARPSLPTPYGCMPKSNNRQRMVPGTTKASKPFPANGPEVRPSKADNTDMAGVIMPSPMSMEAPMTAMMTKGRAAGFGTLRRRAKMPPSPSWSARMMQVIYFTTTTTVRV